MQYPAKLTHEDGGFVVTFRDIPEAITQGESLEEAVLMAEDALATAMEFYFEDARPVPMPSAPEKDEINIALPASFWAKIILLNEMLAQQVTPSELAKKLSTSPQSVNRIVNLRHASKIDLIARALKSLGKRLELQAVPA